MKVLNQYRTLFLLMFLVSVIYSCTPGSSECPVRPLTEKEKAFANKYDPGMFETSIHRVNYEYRKDYLKKTGCKLINTSGEYSYMFTNEPVESFVDTATIRAVTMNRIVELYTNVIDDSVLYATKSFSFLLENEKHAAKSEEPETWYSMNMKIEDVASYAGFKVVKKGNKLVRVTVPKTQVLKMEHETFDPLITK